jgi:hypothetical protein
MVTLEDVAVLGGPPVVGTPVTARLQGTLAGGWRDAFPVVGVGGVQDVGAAERVVDVGAEHAGASAGPHEGDGLDRRLVEPDGPDVPRVVQDLLLPGAHGHPVGHRRISVQCSVQCIVHVMLEV